MNKHILVDNITASLGGLIARRKKFFANSVQSASFEKQVANIIVDCPVFNEKGTYELKAKTFAGELDCAFMVVRWLGNDFPTIIYHHGNNERPFVFKKSAKNSFYNIFINAKDRIDANLIVVRAPFHNGSLKQYQNNMVNLSNFTAMIATSVKLNEEIIEKVRRISSKPIITTGISLGGWVTNLHRAIYNSSDAYVPFMAGAFLGELFLKSKYRKMVSKNALNNPDKIRRILNFHDIFEKRRNHNVSPLLAKYDQFVEYDVQEKSYQGYPLKAIECGHITGAISSRVLREHILLVIKSMN